jgi:hypothetical protein
MSDFYQGRMIPLKIADQAIINCNKEIEKLQIENDRLKALTLEMDKTINISQAGCRELKAEIERLTKAGDELAFMVNESFDFPANTPQPIIDAYLLLGLRKWQTAKEGKQS